MKNVAFAVVLCFGFAAAFDPTALVLNTAKGIEAAIASGVLVHEGEPLVETEYTARVKASVEGVSFEGDFHSSVEFEAQLLTGTYVSTLALYDEVEFHVKINRVCHIKDLPTGTADWFGWITDETPVEGTEEVRGHECNIYILRNEHEKEMVKACVDDEGTPLYIHIETAGVDYQYLEFVPEEQAEETFEPLCEED